MLIFNLTLPERKKCSHTPNVVHTIAKMRTNKRRVIHVLRPRIVRAVIARHDRNVNLGNNARELAWVDHWENVFVQRLGDIGSGGCSVTRVCQERVVHVGDAVGFVVVVFALRDAEAPPQSAAGDTLTPGRTRGTSASNTNDTHSVENTRGKLNQQQALHTYRQQCMTGARLLHQQKSSHARPITNQVSLNPIQRTLGHLCVDAASSDRAIAVHPYRHLGVHSDIRRETYSTHREAAHRRHVLRICKRCID